MIAKVGKVNSYVTIGNCAACNEYEREPYEVTIHICEPDKMNCNFLKEKTFIDPPAHGKIYESGNDIFLCWHEGKEPMNQDMIWRVLEKVHGKKVFIHCTAGAHRAPTLAVAYLYYCLDYDFVEAICRVNAARRQYEGGANPTGFQYHELNIIRGLK